MAASSQRNAINFSFYFVYSKKRKIKNHILCMSQSFYFRSVRLFRMMPQMMLLFGWDFESAFVHQFPFCVNHECRASDLCIEMSLDFADARRSCIRIFRRIANKQTKLRRVPTVETFYWNFVVCDKFANCAPLFNWFSSVHLLNFKIVI